MIKSDSLDITLLSDGGTESEGEESSDVPKPASKFDPATVPEPIQKGLLWLREFHEPAVPIGEEENEIAIYLGSFNLTSFEAEYEQTAVEVIWFIPRDFTNSDPHWMITDELLRRTDTTDGGLRANNDPNPNNDAKILRDYVQEKFDWEDATAWSVRWSNVDLKPSDPKHLRRVTRITERALQDENE